VTLSSTQEKLDRADAVRRKLAAQLVGELEFENEALALLGATRQPQRVERPIPQTTLAHDLRLTARFNVQSNEYTRWQMALQIRTNQLLKQQNNLLGRIADALEKIEGATDQ